MINARKNIEIRIGNNDVKRSPKKKAKLIAAGKKVLGRPTTFNKKIADEICRVVSTTTLSLTQICEKYSQFPCRQTVNEWRLDYPDFGTNYALAKQQQADLLAEETCDIADAADKDKIIDPVTGKTTFDFDHINRMRLRIDTRKWLAAKLFPRVYGDKQQVDATLTVKHEDKLKELE